MKQNDDTPYLEKKNDSEQLTKEDMIYGGGETLSEKKKKDENLQLITE